MPEAPTQAPQPAVSPRDLSVPYEGALAPELCREIVQRVENDTGKQDGVTAAGKRPGRTGTMVRMSSDPAWAEVKRLVGDRVCLIGNVNCGLLDTGTEAQCIESARYALKHGMPGGRYIFSTSNCIYTGMRLERYELILDVWRNQGNYPDEPT